MDESFGTTLATIASQYLGTESPQNYDDQIDDLPQADEISGFSRPLLTFAAVMTVLIMLTGIFGNILTTVALLKCPKVRNVAAAFIISLCIADCIFCAVVLPFSAFRFIQGTWTHGDFLCKLIPFIQYGNIGVSLLCIAMITINRYIMIAHHSAYAKIYKRHWIGAMIVFCWVFSYGMQLPTLLGVWGEFGFDKKLGTCSILRDQFGRSSKTALFAIAFVTPCIIIIACYARIFWVVHESEMRMRKHAHKQNTIPNNMRTMPTGGVDIADGTSGGNRLSSSQNQQVSTSSFETSDAVVKHKAVVSGGGSQKSIRIKDQRDAKAKRNEWRITKMVLAIFLSFVGCYLPITIVKVVDQNVRMPGFHIFAYIMLYLSSCINPIIYVIMNKQYRQAYKTVLMCKPSRLLPFTNAGSSAGEKWKDIGYSYNHSRTMVSQVSLADPNSITSTNQNQQPVVMAELTTKSHHHHHPNNNNNNNNNNINNNCTGTITTTPNSNITNINRRNWLMNGSNTNNNATNNIFQNSSNNRMTQSPPIITTTTNTTNNSVFTTIPLTDGPTTIMETTPIYHPLSQIPQQQQQQQQQILAQLELPPQQLRSIQHQDFQRPGIRITLDEGDVIVEEEMEEPIQMMKLSTEQPVNTTKSKTIENKLTSTPTATSTAVDPIFMITQQRHQPMHQIPEETLNTTVKTNDIPDENHTKVINSNLNNTDNNSHISSMRF